ncbi:cysteine proteinase [Ceraceosorus guamensis]|uniref:Ubiquitin carboxyl-terminal hydrolase n=1 Tax=Ceraceosorus guamensis TaxID=1522189 RepID=A0A316W8R7_9BASI|nr:cysteine proteinase [Ceraceosorus guamensis]PWN44095.1 cysteine proteinase [Ceraceosorus guamensis]
MGLVDYVDSPPGDSPVPNPVQTSPKGLEKGSSPAGQEQSGLADAVAAAPTQQVKTEELEGNGVREGPATDRRVGRTTDDRSRSSTLTDSAPISPRAAEERNALHMPSASTSATVTLNREQTDSSVPQRERGQCSHLMPVLDADGKRRLGHEGGPELDVITDRYRKGIQWGRKIKRREVKTDADDEEIANGNSDDDWRDHEEERRRAKRRKLLPHPKCSGCRSVLHRPWICLSCAFPACHIVVNRQDCLNRHLSAAQHPFAMNILTGDLHCNACEDTVYDARFDGIRAHEMARARRGRRAIPLGPSGEPPHPPIASCRVPRGFRNLGATCFLNVVLQCFLHNPLLRNFFLSDRHNPALCPAQEQCLACELDKIFNEFFSSTEESPPLAPTSFLFVIYLSKFGGSSELSNPGEQDAHELFISAISSIHSSLMLAGEGARPAIPNFPHGDHAAGITTAKDDESEHSSTMSDDMRCPCVVHRAFSGVLQSDVTCSQCGSRSTTRDLFMDLSLDIRSARQRTESASAGAQSGLAEGQPAEEKRKYNKKKQKDGKDAREESAAEEEQTLDACLRRYCAAEKLGRESYSCASCGQGTQAFKQLSLMRLPPVLCFQLKRFEHNIQGTKLETRVRFPVHLDLREYTTSNVGTEMLSYDADSYLYTLFAVVVHTGKSLHSGHYYCYTRYHDQWYRANDDRVVPVSAQEVLSCTAYQLLYQRQNLENVRPGHRYVYEEPEASERTDGPNGPVAGDSVPAINVE